MKYETHHQIENIVGQKYGKLTVISFHHKDKRYNQHWLCKCECGNEIVVSKSNLIWGTTKSCGCMKRQKASQRMKKHGLSTTPIYNLWSAMKKRCNNPNNYNYRWYGARGIKVCDEWANDPVAFYNWAKENGWRKNLTIDRINCNGNYEPSNCRFITIQEQQRNRRNNKK